MSVHIKHVIIHLYFQSPRSKTTVMTGRPKRRKLPCRICRKRRGTPYLRRKSSLFMIVICAFYQRSFLLATTRKGRQEMQNRWDLYDKLIAGIPDDLVVDNYIPSNHFVCLCSGELCGVAHNTKGTSRPSLLPEGPAGVPLRTVASLSKSWNMQDATMGIAAINAYYNDRNRLKLQGVNINDAADVPLKERKANNPTDGSPENLRGKKNCAYRALQKYRKEAWRYCRPLYTGTESCRRRLSRQCM